MLEVVETVLTSEQQAKWKEVVGSTVDGPLPQFPHPVGVSLNPGGVRAGAG